MTMRPLDLVPGDGDAEEESLPLRLPAGLPAETRQALEFAVRAAAEAVLAGRVRVTESAAGPDTAELAFEVRQSEVPEALADPAPQDPAPQDLAAQDKAARRAAMVARIRAGNAETLERLKDL
ncbi:hypothetical protein AB0F71_04855 [Kitasatospora sp. NPDC028055]|uniref:hypothetical protein n=1 Tax=Kitasatospora sp. NPDC028055 TaxID=3155653 RepID=UPI0033D05865